MPKSRHRPSKRRRPTSGYNPVHAAVAIHEVNKEVLDIGLLCFTADDGQEMRNLIADAAYFVGLGAEIAIALDKQSPMAKRLHCALRALIAMALNDCKWVAAQAQFIHSAVEESKHLALQHAGLGLMFAQGCQQLGNAIRHNDVPHDAVAGAEIYNEDREGVAA